MSLNIELIGWIGFVFIVLGYILNARQMISCFPVWIVGNILLSYYAIVIGSQPQLATGVIVLMMNIYGYREWSNNND